MLPKLLSYALIFKRPKRGQFLLPDQATLAEILSRRIARRTTQIGLVADKFAKSPSDFIEIVPAVPPSSQTTLRFQ